MSNEAGQNDVERVYRLWDDALGKKDLEASLSLYADDASIESPLVQYLLNTSEGIVQGKENLRRFIAMVFRPIRRSASDSSKVSSATAAWSPGNIRGSRRRATRWIWWRSWKSRAGSSDAIGSTGAGTPSRRRYSKASAEISHGRRARRCPWRRSAPLAWCARLASNAAQAARSGREAMKLSCARHCRPRWY